MRALEDHLHAFLAGNGAAEAAEAALDEALRSEHEALRDRAAGLLIDALPAAAPGPRARILFLLQSAWWPVQPSRADAAFDACVAALTPLEDEGPEVQDAALLWATLSRDVPKLTARIEGALSHDAWAVRLSATLCAGRLFDAKSTGLEALLARLADPDQRVALAAVDAVGQLAQDVPDRAVPVLQQEVRTADGERRFRALTALRAVMEHAAQEGARIGEQGGSLAPALRAALGDPEEAVRLQAAALLGLRGERTSDIQTALEAALKEPSAEVSATAAAALLRLGAPPAAALGRLGALLSGDRAEEQEAALTALAPLEPAALARARSVLEAGAKAEGDISEAAKELLSRLGSD